MTDKNKIDLNQMGVAAKKAAQELAQMDTPTKNQILRTLADDLVAGTTHILAANAADLNHATIDPKFIDRLRLTPDRIADMADGMRQVATLPDPTAVTDRGWRNEAGLQIDQRRVPLGVVGMIYEARPNVTVDAAALCLKSGNAVILRGGREALSSNQRLAHILRKSLQKQGVNPDAIQLIDNPSHALAEQFMHLQALDVLIPRGGANLIQRVVKTATVPVIETGAGNCHIYVDQSADLQMAINIVVNAKVQRPSVCNAAEKLLIHEAVADEYLPKIAAALRRHGVELRGDAASRQIVPDIIPATAADWDTEYNDLIMAVKVVPDLTTAIDHINAHNTKHSEAIITNDYAAATTFQNLVDAACVYVNASTRFTDGFEFGFGSEIGISTQKLHARGPMGLNALTTIKYVINGNGQVRK